MLRYSYSAHKELGDVHTVMMMYIVLLYALTR
jgi:hypothetical protein